MSTAQESLIKCKKCKQSGYLVMQITVCDEVCEACGTWQNGSYNDIYARVVRTLADGTQFMGDQ